MSEALLIFLDANVLASPATRTLLIAGARADGLRWTWSRHVEVEADRHARGQAPRTSVVRTEVLGTELSPTPQGTEGLVTGTAQDNQVMADAIRAGARYLITTDVDDFAVDDLAAHGMSAVNPDYFNGVTVSKDVPLDGFPRVLKQLRASDHILVLLYWRGTEGATVEQLKSWARAPMRAQSDARSTASMARTSFTSTASG